MYDEHGEPSEDLVMHWNEANDHAGDGDQPDEDEPDGCGYSYDHKLKVIGERDGIVNEVCDECGAELTTDTNADGPDPVEPPQDVEDRWDNPDTNDGIVWARGDE